MDRKVSLETTIEVEVTELSQEEDLTKNDLFGVILKKYDFVLNAHKKQKFLALIPPNSVCRGIVLGNNIIESHVLYAKTTHGKHRTLNAKVVSFRDGVFFPDEGFSTRRPIRVLSEEIFYTEDGKSIRILHVDNFLDIEPELPTDTGMDEMNSLSVFHGIPKKATLADYIHFLRLSPENNDILQRLDEYIGDFNSNYVMSAGSEAQLWKRVKSIWIDVVKCLIHTNPQYSSCHTNTHNSNEIKIAVECYLMNGIYNCIFDGLCSIHANEDLLLIEKISKLNKAPSKDITNVLLKFRSDFSASIDELANLIHLYTPIEKLRCLQKSVREIHRIAGISRQHSIREHAVITTDELISVLSYVISKAAVPNLHAHLTYMQDFRFSTLANTELGYHFATYQAVVSHLLNEKLGQAKKGALPSSYTRESPIASMLNDRSPTFGMTEMSRRATNSTAINDA